MAILPRRWSTSFILGSCAIISLWYLSSLADNYAPESLSNAPQPGTVIPSDGLYHWTKTKERYPVKSMIPLPTGQPLHLPRLQRVFEPEKEEDKAERLKRRDAVLESFKHSWNGYKDTAWPKDELAPVSGGYYNTFGGWGATLVDSLDSLYIMGMEDEFDKAVEAVKKIDFTTTEGEALNVFETTIRYLGGLLGAYDISNGKHPILLQKAKELGEVLYSAFDTPNRMPVARWKWREASKKQEAGENTLIAELGSLTLEFTRLSQLTGDPKYFDAIQRITNTLDVAQSKTWIPGLWPVLVNAKSLSFRDTGFTIGGMADSLYEYLPKQHMLLGGLTDQYKNMYESALAIMKKLLFFRPMTIDGKDILLAGNVRYDDKRRKVIHDPQGQHLGCFAGGMVAIGATLFEKFEDLAVARKLIDACIWSYGSTSTGLMPETFHMVPCEDPKFCPWDEQKWHDALTKRQRDDETSKSMNPEDRLRYMIETRKLPPGYTDIVRHLNAVRAQ